MKPPLNDGGKEEDKTARRTTVKWEDDELLACVILIRKFLRENPDSPVVKWKTVLVANPDVFNKHRIPQNLKDAYKRFESKIDRNGEPPVQYQEAWRRLKEKKKFSNDDLNIRNDDLLISIIVIFGKTLPSSPCN